MPAAVLEHGQVDHRRVVLQLPQTQPDPEDGPSGQQQRHADAERHGPVIADRPVGNDERAKAELERPAGRDQLPLGEAHDAGRGDARRAVDQKGEPEQQAVLDVDLDGKVQDHAAQHQQGQRLDQDGVAPAVRRQREQREREEAFEQKQDRQRLDGDDVETVRGVDHDREPERYPHRPEHDQRPPLAPEHPRADEKHRQSDHDRPFAALRRRHFPTLAAQRSRRRPRGPLAAGVGGTAGGFAAGQRAIRMTARSLPSRLARLGRARAAAA